MNATDYNLNPAALVLLDPITEEETALARGYNEDVERLRALHAHSDYARSAEDVTISSPPTPPNQ